MARKSISLTLIVSFLWYCGCVDTTRVVVNPNEVSGSEKIVTVVTLDGTTYHFSDYGGRFNPVRKSIDDVYAGGRSIPMDEISYVVVERETVDVGKTILVTIGVLALTLGVLILIALATKQSCPFIYSYDGEKYIFDAEPLGGAICEGLARTDWSRLKHLKPDDGKYKFVIRNEVAESQYVDMMHLLVIDHPEGTTVSPTLGGAFYQSAAPVLPARAWDSKGTNLLPFVRALDGVFWQSNLMGDTTALLVENPYDELTFVFPKPEGARHAEILLGIGTSMWGSNMIRKHMELYGDKADMALQMITASTAVRDAMYARIIRDRTLMMHVEVLQNGTWTPQTLVHGAGPLIADDRAYSVDLSAVQGDSVHLRFRPAIGYWTLDYIALEYNAVPATNIRELPIASAKDADGNDISSALSTTDSVYFEMPRTGDEATLTFDEVPRVAGMARSYFMKTSGYYTLHLSNEGPMNAALLNELDTTPGAIVRYAMREFLKWKNNPAEFSRTIQKNEEE